MRTGAAQATRQTFQGTSGDDAFIGTARKSYFYMEDGGADTVSASAGRAIFYFGASLDAGDRVTGGPRGGTLHLDGDYDIDLAMVSGVEDFRFEGAHRYNVRMGDPGLRPDARAYVWVDGALSARIDATAVTNDTNFALFGDAGKVRAGSGDDDFYVSRGVYVIDGGGGRDQIGFGGDAVHLDLRLTGQAQTFGDLTVTLRGIEDAYGTFRDDVIVGDRFGNFLNGNSGDDMLDGGRGDDSLLGDFGDDILHGGKGDDRLGGYYGDDTLDGGDGDDTLDGEGGGADRLSGGDGADRLFASDDATLGGGAGADRFLFDGRFHTRATIADFAPGDLIDVSGMDANPGRPGDQAFHFGATAGHRGDLIVTYDAASDQTVVALYTNADAAADAHIYLPGQVSLTADDFVF